MEGDYIWRGHGEVEELARSYGNSSQGGPSEELKLFEQMVYDIAGPSFVADDEPVNESVPEDPNNQKFRKLLTDANTPLWAPPRKVARLSQNCLQLCLL